MGMEEQNKLMNLFPTLRLPYANVQSPNECMDWFLSSLHVYKQGVMTLESVFAIICEKHRNDTDKNTTEVLDATNEVLITEENQAVVVGEEMSDLMRLNSDG